MRCKICGDTLQWEYNVIKGKTDFKCLSCGHIAEDNEILGFLRERLKNKTQGIEEKDE